MNRPCQAPKGFGNSRKEDLQLFVLWKEGNNHHTLVQPSQNDGVSRFSPGSSQGSWCDHQPWRATGCSNLAEGWGKGLLEPPQPGIGWASHFPPGAREGAQIQERLSVSICLGRGSRHWPVNQITGQKEVHVPWDRPDAGEAKGF